MLIWLIRFRHMAWPAYCRGIESYCGAVLTSGSVNVFRQAFVKRDPDDSTGHFPLHASVLVFTLCGVSLNGICCKSSVRRVSIAAMMHTGATRLLKGRLSDSRNLIKRKWQSNSPAPRPGSVLPPPWLHFGVTDQSTTTFSEIPRDGTQLNCRTYPNRFRGHLTSFSNQLLTCSAETLSIDNGCTVSSALCLSKCC